jgi:S1-C subfamily serine protease
VPAGTNKEGKTTYRLYLVTAAHVVRNHPQGLGPLAVRQNPRTGDGIGFHTDPTAWFFHPTEDVAVTRVNIAALKEVDIDPSIFFAADHTGLDKKALAENQVEAGDGIFVLGFPLGLSGEKRNYAIARGGNIARIREMIEGRSSTFLIDAAVYPGNSGGPVVLRPDPIALEGTKSHPQSALIGLVKSYRPYVDTAISRRSGHG